MATLFIKNMVCNRCVMVVRETLQKMEFEIREIRLGEAVLDREPSMEEKNQIRTQLEAMGFELIDDKKSRIIDRIKTLIIEQIHQQDSGPKVNLSSLLSRELGHDYTYLSNLFSEVEGTTIEKYFIAQKIERVKELLVYDELSLSEIADQLSYSSVAYLSNQFKKITGLTPSHFRQIGLNRRKPLDEV